MRELRVLDEPPEGPCPPVFRLLAHDGVYEVRTSPLGQFVARVESRTVLNEGFYPAVPRCPASLLSDTVRIFKERPDTEALVSVVYDREEETFLLVWQGEKADAASVTYDPLPEDERYVLYAEIHSHHRMAAYFSRTDDGSERPAGAYGVIGRVDREKPEAVFRYASGGSFYPLRAEELFGPAPEVWRTIEQPCN